MPAQITSHPQDANGKTLGHVYVPTLSPSPRTQANVPWRSSSNLMVCLHLARSFSSPHCYTLQVDTLIANATIEEQVSC